MSRINVNLELSDDYHPKANYDGDEINLINFTIYHDNECRCSQFYTIVGNKNIYMMEA